MDTGDKYDPVIMPHCKPTPFQVLILHSFPFLTPQQQLLLSPKSSSSSSSEDDEQPTAIIMLSLSDDYQTPPQENSPENVVHLDNDTEEILDETDTENIATLDTPQKDAPQVLDEMPQKDARQVFDAHHVFDEMPDREPKDVAVLDRGKRKLPVSLLDNKLTENNSTEGECSKHHVFKLTINSVLKMLVAEGRGKGDDGKGVDFLDTAKKKGMTFPRPRWRSAEAWKGL